MQNANPSPCNLLPAKFGWKELIDDVESFGASNTLTALVPYYDNVDPDEAYSCVPYEKGAAFFQYLETAVRSHHMGLFVS